MSIFTPHPYKHKNVNDIHKAEKENAGFNQRIAVWLTNLVGTMVCAYVFAVLAIIGWPGTAATPTQWVQWVSQTFIQLVMLSVIMVGQKVIGRHQELQSEEQYNTTMKTYHDIEQVMHHLDAQDKEVAHLVELLPEIKNHMLHMQVALEALQGRVSDLSRKRDTHGRFIKQLEGYPDQGTSG